MQLQEEFSRLIHLYQMATEGKLTSVQEVFKKSLEFIEHLKEIITTGDAEDKQAAIRMMKELHEQMKNHTKTLCEVTGLSEEKLLADSENPALFTPDQWRKMQEDKERLAKAGRDLVSAVQETEEKHPGSTKAPKAASPIRKKRGVKKQGWIRS